MDLGRRRDDGDAIDLFATALLEQERDIEHHQLCTCMLEQKGLAQSTNGRMNDGFEPGES